VDISISVYIVTMNRFEFLKRAVDSVLNQSEKDFELIIVDNGSKDETLDYLADLVLLNPKVTCIYLDENKGACYARNKAIEVARGKYITGMDDDDFFEHHRLHDLKKCYEENEGCSFVFSDDNFVNQGVYVFRTKKPNRITLEMLKYQNFVGNQVFSELSKFKSVGGFDETLLAAQDYDMWLRLVYKFGAAIKSIEISQNVELGCGSRISTSPKKFTGYFDFYKKHKSLMSRSQRKHQLLNIKYSCRTSISLKFFIILFSFNCISRKAKIFISKVLKSSAYGY